MKKILVMVIMVVSQSAMSGGWQNHTKINSYTAEGGSAGDRVYVKFDDIFNPDSCNGSEKDWVRVDGSTPKGKILVSSIISALATKQTVVPLLNSCDDWGRPILEGLRVGG